VIWNSVLLATSAPFFAAYGDRAKPFSQNNLILTGSLLGWLVVDEIIDAFAGNSGALKGLASLWSYLAPIGNGATAFFLLDNKQHERFVSGVTEIPVGAPGVVTVSLTDGLIAKSAVDDFKKEKHAVVATLLDPASAAGTVNELRATVNDGNLTLIIDPGLTVAAKVAWIVDTKASKQ
jgi:hypothetical protein